MKIYPTVYSKVYAPMTQPDYVTCNPQTKFGSAIN